MNKEEILKNLPESCPWQDSLLWFDSIDSTNTRAKALAASGAPEGTVLIADCQTGGRGSRGRSFLSPAGSGIYMSIILRPNCYPVDIMHLTCAVGTAMCDAVENVCGIRPGVKWANDLVLEGRKIAGILTELSVLPCGKIDYLVIGIGINCCQKQADFPEEIRSFAGSLFSITGKSVDRSILAAAMVQSLQSMNNTLLQDKSVILDRYRKDCITIGREISLVRADGIIKHGVAVGLDDAALLVRLDDGSFEAVSSGEVSVRGMYGYV